MRGLTGRREVLFGAAALGLLGAFPLRAGNAALPEPAAIGIRAAREWAARSQIMRYDVGEVHAVHYAEAATALGVARLAERLQGAGLGEQVAGRWERARAVPNSANHVDANVIGLWPMLLGDPQGTGIALADGQWDEVEETGLSTQARFWIDDIWMIGALQVQAWRLTGEARFLDRAALMARIYVGRLQQAGGLFHHGPEAPFFWGRGNGWVAAGLAEVLSVLPESHGDRPAILDAYRRMMAALLEHQAEDGMWRQLIDRPDAWKESSGSAMFGFAMLRGVGAGLLEADAFEPAARRAWDALAARVDGEGRLSGICVGTGQSRDAQYYLDRPRVAGDLHGQAPLLWLAAEMLA